MKEEDMGDEDDDGDDEVWERTPVPCCYPGCTRLTYIDPTYGDLCFEHIRAPNE